MRHQESSQETRDHRMTPVKTSAVSSHSGARGKDGAVVGDSYRSFQNFKCYYLVTSLAILGASPYSGSWWWTGRPGVRRFMGSQRVGHDWTTDLIWSDLKRGTIKFIWLKVRMSTYNATWYWGCMCFLAHLLEQFRQKRQLTNCTSTFKKLRSWHLVPFLHGKKMGKQWK